MLNKSGCQPRNITTLNPSASVISHSDVEAGCVETLNKAVRLVMFPAYHAPAIVTKAMMIMII